MELLNPFTDLVICNPRKLSYPEPHRIALMAAGHLQGGHGILGTFPEAVRPMIRQHLMNSRATWWNPSTIWDALPQCCTTTIPCPYTSCYCRRLQLRDWKFAKLKDWRRIATRYDCCAHTFLSAICIAAAMLFYL